MAATYTITHDKGTSFTFYALYKDATGMPSTSQVKLQECKFAEVQTIQRWFCLSRDLE